MKIYANGCSFTFGDELKNPNESAWPVMLANKLNGSIYNNAISGGTNSRTVYNTIKNSWQDYDLYLIAWTTYTRFTFYKSDNNFEINFNPQLKNKIYSEEKFFKQWGETLYKVWFNELYAFKKWLQEIILLQRFLDQQPYLMINTFDNNLKLWLSDESSFIKNIKSLINFDIMNDEQIFEEFKEIQYYISCIDISKFYNWEDFSIRDLTSKFDCGSAGHILENGHAYLSELIYNHLCLK
jgi:hypothetical protein